MYYAGGFQYVQYFAGGQPLVLKYFSQPEGYVEPNGSSFKYVYQYKDHLGNVRLSYSDANNDGAIANSEIIEEDNYYPFGLQHSGYNNTATSSNTGQKIKFQSQERQDELGLNWDSFKWRNYDPAIGRFMCVDPLAQKYTYNSPYAFAENKVGLGRELEGCELGPLLTFSDLPPVETISTESAMPEMNIALDDLVVTSGPKPNIGFFERIGNALGKMWDSITGNGNDAKPNTPMENAIEEVAKPEVAKEGSKGGRGSNNRTPDDEAVGDHTVRDDKGSTTYRENPNNPNKNSQGKGFETEKRVDYEGASHKTKQGESIPTPHVHEGKEVRPAIPGQDMPLN